VILSLLGRNRGVARAESLGSGNTESQKIDVSAQARGARCPAPLVPDIHSPIPNLISSFTISETHCHRVAVDWQSLFCLRCESECRATPRSRPSKLFLTRTSWLSSQPYELPCFTMRSTASVTASIAFDGRSTIVLYNSIPCTSRSIDSF
jgi:hypothetical protein